MSQETIVKLVKMDEGYGVVIPEEMAADLSLNEETSYHLKVKNGKIVIEFLEEKIRREPNAAFMRPLKPSKELARILGEGEIRRTDAVKKMWEYIKKNGLQDKRDINADEALKPVFGKDRITMFELAKVMSKHLSR